MMPSTKNDLWTCFFCCFVLACYNPTFTTEDSCKSMSTCDMSTMEQSFTDSFQTYLPDATSSSTSNITQTGFNTGSEEEVSSSTTGTTEGKYECGNHIQEPEEQCDDGSENGNYNKCKIDCSGLGSHCGDGVVDEIEECDDGDLINGNGCNQDCSISAKQLWKQTYTNGGSADVAYTVTVSDAGVIYIGGALDLSNANLWLAAYSPTGDPAWPEPVIYDKGGPESANDIQIDKNGDLIVVGQAYGLTSDLLIYKYNQQGEPLWPNPILYDGGKSDRGDGIAMNSVGDLFIIGTSQDQDKYYSTWIHRYSSGGQALWPQPKLYETEPQWADQHIAIDPNDDSWVIVRESSPGNGNIWLQKYNHNGLPLWANPVIYSGISADDGNGVAIDGNGDIIVVGGSIGSGDYDAWIHRYNAQGEPVWVNPVIYDGGQHDEARSVAIDHEGNIVVVGTSNANVSAWIHKYKGNGEALWPEPFVDSSNSSGANDVAIAPDNSIVVVGKDGMEIWMTKFNP